MRRNLNRFGKGITVVVPETCHNLKVEGPGPESQHIFIKHTHTPILEDTRVDIDYLRLGPRMYCWASFNSMQMQSTLFGSRCGRPLQKAALRIWQSESPTGFRRVDKIRLSRLELSKQLIRWMRWDTNACSLSSKCQVYRVSTSEPYLDRKLSQSCPIGPKAESRIAEVPTNTAPIKVLVVTFASLGFGKKGVRVIVPVTSGD
jgi:hypothetical protein